MVILVSSLSAFSRLPQPDAVIRTIAAKINAISRVTLVRFIFCLLFSIIFPFNHDSFLPFGYI